MERLLKCHLPAGQQFNMSNFPHINGKTGPEYLALVSHFVSTNKHKSFKLKNPAGTTFTIGGLEDTMYRDQADEVNGWGKFYLPEIVKMQVVGVVTGTSCPCDQLVMMICENKKVYAYNGEELHLVALSLEQLRDKGIEYPASKRYYDGEAFKDMTEKDWAKARESEVGRRLDEEHNNLVMSMKSRFLKNLKSSRQRAGMTR